MENQAHAMYDESDMSSSYDYRQAVKSTLSLEDESENAQIMYQQGVSFGDGDEPLALDEYYGLGVS